MARKKTDATDAAVATAIPTTAVTTTETEKAKKDAKKAEKEAAEEQKRLKAVEQWFQPPNSTEVLKVEPGEVAIRMYGQGIGDCFLLAFPRPDADRDARPYYVLIDCGVVVGTPDPEERMDKVTYGVKMATGGVIDLLIITHQHWDHISAFQTAQFLWDGIEIRDLWMAWTENDGATGNIAEVQGRLRAVRKRSETAVKKLADNALRFGFADLVPELMSRAAFLGVDTEGEGAGTDAEEAGTDAIMDYIRQRCKGGPTFCAPKEVRPVGETGVRAFILGPPINYERLTEEDPGEDGYHWPDEGDPEDVARHSRSDATHLAPPPTASNGMRSLRRDATELTERNSLAAAALSAFGAFAADSGSSGGVSDAALLEQSFPFAERYRIPWPTALAQGEIDLRPPTGIAEAGLDSRPSSSSPRPFASYVIPLNDWRRVDFDWLGVAETFAIAADHLTNNTSLVIAFELPGDSEERPVLLFVGDAQAGNWRSWWEITGWKAAGGLTKVPEGKNAIGDLLARTVFYKVGHHGSHNASLKTLGVEQMGSRLGALTAFIPVSHPTAHAVKRWCEMPFDPLCKDLIERADGRLFTPRGRLLKDRPTSIPPHDPDVAFSSLQLSEKIRKKDRDLARKSGGDPLVLEPAVPLWIQVRLDSRTGRPKPS